MGASDPSGGLSKRKGSLSDSPTSSSVPRNARPSSSSGWLGGGAHSFTLAGFMRSSGSKVKEVVVPILATPTEGKEEDSHTPPVSTFVTVPTSNCDSNTSTSAVGLSLSKTLTFDTPSSSSHTRRKSSSFAFKRKESVSDCPTAGSSSSVSRNARPSSSSGWLGGGARSLVGFTRSSESKVKEVIVPILATPNEGKEENVSDSSTPPVSTFVTVPTSNTSSRPAVELSRTLTFDAPSSSSHTRRKSSSFAFKRKGIVSDCPTAGSSSSVSRNARPSSSSGWLGGGARSFAGFTRSSESKVKEVIVPILATPNEGKEENVSDSSTPPVSTFVTVPTSNTSSRPAVELSRTLTFDTPSSYPSTRRKSFSLLTFPLKSPQVLDHQASQPITITPERTGPSKSPDQSKNVGSFSKSFTSMMGGLSSLSLSRTSTREGCVDDKERGRSMGKIKRPRSASHAASDLDRFTNNSTSRTRSQSPFSLRRFRTRESSPTPQALPLSQSEADLSVTTASLFPRSTDFTDDDWGDDADAETEYGSSSDEAEFDLITERNTEHNALIPQVDPNGAVEFEDPDPVGEGVNVVVAPEPYFPSSLNTLGSMNRGKRNPRRRKSVKTYEPLSFHTSRPIFQRDRCTITITQGDPEGKLGTRKRRQYVVASDLSQESRYAVEWGIGTVLRDGDEMLIVTVVENDSKVDPAIPNAADRATKLRSQQERQGLAYILARQVTGLLQRTKLNVKISCQAWHAKNSRHMLLDVVDYVEPTMLIVGSRGLGQLNGILLGSTSHYLIQKCSVPVMVARRRLKRPPKKSAHLSTRRAHVSLAEAGIDRVAARVDEDIQVMRNEIEKDDKRRLEKRRGSRDDGRFEGNLEEADDEDEDEDGNDDVGVKSTGD